MTADVTLTRRYNGETLKLQGTVKLVKPNFARIELRGDINRKLIRRMTATLTRNGETVQLEATLKNVKVGANLTPTDFKFAPPSDLSENPMVQVGTQSPDFTLPTLTGKQVSLERLRKGKKALLINFWFYR